MVLHESVCLRRLGGRRSQEVRFGRYLANSKVTIERLIEGWSEQTGPAAAGRHVLAIQDTSEINFKTTAARRRGLGEIGKGVGRGVLLHGMLALDADSGSCLGLVAGQVWTRNGRAVIPHRKRALEDRESNRWIFTGMAAKTVLGSAAMITIIGDRESDFYAAWACLPGPNFHLISRAMNDRCLVNGGKLFAAGADFQVVATRTIELRERAGRPERKATVHLRFGQVTLQRPDERLQRHLPDSVTVTLVELFEPDPPKGAERLHWRLLTTHQVVDAESAWRIVHWYKQRWTIEQLWRLLKRQGLKLEDSQVVDAEELIKLTAIAAKAAAITLQLQQARDGKADEPATIAFREQDIAALEATNTHVEGKTALQKNPHRKHSLAWAAWIIARLGGWDGYPSSRPPGPITFRYGLEQFRIMLVGWRLRNVCTP